MMNISEFIHTCHYNFPIPYDGECNFTPFIYTQLSDDNDICIYNSEYEFVDEISQAIAKKLYETEELLKDIPITTDEIWEVRGNRGYYFQDDYWNLPHITLSDLAQLQRSSTVIILHVMQLRFEKFRVGTTDFSERGADWRIECDSA